MAASKGGGGGVVTNVNLDNIMAELGQFGKFQLFNYLLIAVPVVLAACNNGNYVFTAADLNYRCYVPECDGSLQNATLDADWLSTAMPHANNPRRCTRYAPWNATRPLDPGGSCSAASFDPNRLIECDQWVFGESKSIVKELGIQCQFWKRTLVGTIHSFGLLFALPIIGFVSDRYGRKVAFIMSAFFAGVFGVIRSFANSYLVFVLFEFLEPLFGSGVYSSGFILGMELVGPKRRVLGGTILSMFYSIGGILLGSIAWAVPYWRDLLRVVYAPSLLFILYFFVVNESVRWLISKGRYQKAIDIVKKAAKVNGVTLTEKSMENLYSNVEIKNELKNRDVNNVEDNEKPKEKRISPMRQVLKSPIILRRVIKCSFWWITCTLVYYGLSINSVSLAGNIYLNYILVSVVELPAYLTGFYLLNKLGRKYTLCCSFIISGIACVAFPFLPEDLATLSLVMYLVGKFFITIAFGSCYIYTSELFPTPLRHSLLGTCSMIGRIGSIVAPQTPLLAEYMPSLPSLIFGACSAVSGILMLSSPETLNIKLPDTIEEAENLSRKPKKKVEESPS